MVNEPDLSGVTVEQHQSKLGHGINRDKFCCPINPNDVNVCGTASALQFYSNYDLALHGRPYFVLFGWVRKPAMKTRKCKIHAGVLGIYSQQQPSTNVETFLQGNCFITWLCWSPHSLTNFFLYIFWW